MHVLAIDDKSLSILLMLAAGVPLYAVSRLAVVVLTRPDGSDPGRRALAQWFPIAATAIAAMLWRSEDAQMQRNLARIAIAVVFGTSVACLSLVAGIATYLTPLNNLPASKKVWPFVLGLALLLLLAGFSGHLIWWHALILLAMGGAIVPVWRSEPEGPDGVYGNPTFDRRAGGAMLAAVAMCAVGGYFAIKGTLVISAASTHAGRTLSPGTLAATVLSPLLVLPMLGTASAVAQRGHPGRAVTALVGTVFLNLCALLPVLIICWYLKFLNGKLVAASILESFRNLSISNFKDAMDSFPALPYDMAAWRIETVVLVVLGFAMLPIAMGRWVMGKFESTLLVIIYGVYVVVLALYELRSH